MAKRTGPSLKTRQATQARDDYTCQWGGDVLGEDMGDLQHRRARGAGGSSLVEINSPANLILICRDHHMFIEAYPLEAAARGFRLGIGELPEYTPLEDWTGARWILGHNAQKKEA